MSRLPDSPDLSDEIERDERLPMTTQERRLVLTSSIGTIFQWYDFFLYGAMASVIARQFFTSLEPGAAFILTLLAFAAGFVVRPIGAVIFGHLGDRIGRKQTFLATVLLMGISTVLVALLPTYSTAGVFAPIALVALRMLQGLALGGEYGGAVIYVAEHAPQHQRGAYTGWIQTTATIGLLLSLLVVLGVRTLLGEAAFADWGWRVPFGLSALMLSLSLWLRLSLTESPAFRRMQQEGRGSKAPLAECFGQWKNLRVIVLALFGLVAGQAVIWYTGQFYALFFLTGVLKVEASTATWLMTVALLITLPLFVGFGMLSDRIGRKPVIMTGLLLACLGLQPLYHALTHFANPALAEAQQKVRIVVRADPATCSFQANPLATDLSFSSACDIAKRTLAQLSASYHNEAVAPGTPTEVRIGETVLQPPEGVLTDDGSRFDQDSLLEVSHFRKEVLPDALAAAGYPVKADPDRMNRVGVVLVLAALMVLVAMVYGPLGAALVEMFPTRIRYTAMSLPYHLGNGWFGGLLPSIAFGMSAQDGSMYHGLWFPIAVAGLTFAVGLAFIRETKDVDIYAKFLYWHPNRLGR
ncbi:MFS family permease [Sphaerotilus sulfidivorans]|uniref:MFS family permease n=2 Tax=Sphaerotilus sulfidivorans TaxID=639200 RepID=A0ABV2IKV3_9BURK|nr:MFS transporter [Sphaerotilus sulfidivorans]